MITMMVMIQRQLCLDSLLVYSLSPSVSQPRSSTLLSWLLCSYHTPPSPRLAGPSMCLSLYHRLPYLPWTVPTVRQNDQIQTMKSS